MGLALNLPQFRTARPRRVYQKDPLFMGLTADFTNINVRALGIPYCDSDARLLQLKQGAAGLPESLGNSAARISPAGAPRTTPGRARPGDAAAVQL